LVLRVIAVDYPGIGDSSIVLHRTLVGWAIDMDEFCQEMFGDSRIAILSHCMGGPHAISMLYHARLSQRIRSVTLVSPWLPLEHSIESPWLFDVARHLPSVIQDNFIPFFATTMTNSSLTMAGSIAMCSNNSARMLVVQEITGYGKFQGQDGNRQMVRLASLLKSKPFLLIFQCLSFMAKRIS
jgi:pimeloyl-ACP methyl ester carboxylesterase